MLLREFFDQNLDTAVISFGRMNPPTIGHKKLIEKIVNIPGDHYLFLSQTHNKKTDPLDFDTKLQFVESYFPQIKVGNKNVKTVIDALKNIDQKGYKNLVYVAGSDRVDAFEALINKYNNIEYNFENITVVNAGIRDADKNGVEGISASKLREAAIENDFESFSLGAPCSETSLKLFNSVRQGLGLENELVT